MGAPPHQQTITEYLAWESGQSGRNEFWRGEVFAMVGGKRGHGRVTANLKRHIGNHLDDTASSPANRRAFTPAPTPSTQACDRSKKFAMYRQLASLREYALIDPGSRRVEVFRPAEDGHWKLFDMSDDDALVLESVACTVALLAVCKGMDGN